MRNYDLKNIKSFFGAYFHEDWVLENDDPLKMVEIYCSSTQRAEALKLAEDIFQFINECQDNEIPLFELLGCYYDPSSERISKKDWLIIVVERLKSYNTKV
jgi:hypothetical protein